MTARENPADDGAPAANALPAFTVRRQDEFWVVEIDGTGTILLTTTELCSNRKFIQACMRELGRCFAPVRPAEWNRTLDTAMRNGGGKP
jgi:hypothetical protein